MLRVSYKKVYGYFTIKTQEGQIYRCSIHPANCEFAVVYHDRKRKLAQLICWFNDLRHLKRCFEDKIFNELVSVTLFTNMPNFQRYVKPIADSGIKLNIRYRNK